MTKGLEFRKRLISNTGARPHLLVGPSVGFVTTLNLSGCVRKLGGVTAGLPGLSRAEGWRVLRPSTDRYPVLSARLMEGGQTGFSDLSVSANNVFTEH